MAYLLALGLLLAILAGPAQAQSPSHLLGSDDMSVAGGSQAQSGEGTCLRGRLTKEGIECPALRGEDGNLYTLAGDTAGFEAGDEICVCGTVAEVSLCMQGTTIAVIYVSSAKDGCPP